MTKKVALVVAENLAVWQKINVTAFLSAGIAAEVEGLIGAPYRDQSEKTYAPLLVTPVHVYAASTEKLSTVLGRTQTRDVTTSIYIEDMFATSNDNDNRATVTKYATDDLPLVGLAVCGDPKQVDKVIRGLKRHE